MPDSSASLSVTYARSVNGISIMVSAGLVDTITAIATAAAALVAAWAVISANNTARRSREHQRLAERYDAAVDLLAAFEERCLCTRIRRPGPARYSAPRCFTTI